MRGLLVTFVVVATVGLYFVSCSSAPRTVEEKETSASEAATAPAPETAPAKAVSEKPKQTSFTPYLAQLPTVAEVRKKKRDVHHAPPELREASKVLGSVARQMKQDPTKVASGIQFYADCASRDELLTPVRVLCLRNWRHWAKRSGAAGPDDSQFPQEMLNAERDLPPL